MKTKKLLIGEKRTKILLAKTNETMVELQKVNGRWYKIGEHENTKLSLKDLYGLVFEFGFFVDFNTKKPFRVVLDRSLAQHYCNLGYLLVDSHYNLYQLRNGSLLRNGKDELVALPGTERYILEPFSQKYIAEEKKESTSLRSKEQKQKQREELKVAHPFDTDALRQVKKNMEKTQNKPSKATSESVWEWVIPLAIGGAGIAALTCLIGKLDNNHHQNKFYYHGKY